MIAFGALTRGGVAAQTREVMPRHRAAMWEAAFSADWTRTKPRGGQAPGGARARNWVKLLKKDLLLGAMVPARGIEPPTY